MISDRRAGRRVRPTVIVALSAFVLARAAGARADEEPPTARAEALRALKEGNVFFQEGHYAAALERYREAYARVPSPKLFFNLGQSYRNLGRSPEALDAYLRFLDEVRDAPPALVDEAQRHVAQLRKAVAAVFVRARVDGVEQAGADVVIDGVVRGTTPLARPLFAFPGPHRIVVSRPGSAPYAGDLDLRGGESIEVVAELASGTERPAGPASVAAVNAAAIESAPSRAAASGRQRGRVGLLLRADLDEKLRGAGAAAAITYGLAEHADVAVGGLLWPAEARYVTGLSLGGTAYLAAGLLRPLVSGDAQVYFSAGAHWAARGAAGLQIQVAAHYAVQAALAVEHTSVGFREATILVPAIGLHARL